MTKIITKSSLPFGLKESDLKWPKRPRDYKWGKPHQTDVLHSIVLYETQRFGWIVTTLLIRNPGRHSRSDAQARTYGVDKDGKVVRVGLGPHVLRTIEVHVTRGRAEALKTLSDLYVKGLADAGSIRDRISSRRAQTNLRRFDLGY